MATFPHFQNVLLKQLADRCPSLCNDRVFVDNRCERAIQVYQDSIEQGLDEPSALENAESELLEDIEFVAHDLLMEIIEVEFSSSILSEQRDAICQQLFGQAQALCDQHNYMEENRFDPSFSHLYAKLTEVVARYVDGL